MSHHHSRQINLVTVFLKPNQFADTQHTSGSTSPTEKTHRKRYYLVFNLDLVVRIAKRSTLRTVMGRRVIRRRAINFKELELAE